MFPIINTRTFNTGWKPKVSLHAFSLATLAGSVFALANVLPGLAQSALPSAPSTTADETASKAAAQPAYATATQAPTQAAPTQQAPQQIDSRIILNIEERRVYLYQGDMLLSSYPVAVGTAATPTPRGEFTVSKMVVNPVWQSPWTGEITPPGPNSALGLRWIEFTTSEAGAFGFHGTPTIDSIGYAASNGCVRMRNEDVVALFSQVSVGTPVLIQ